MNKLLYKFGRFLTRLLGLCARCGARSTDYLCSDCVKQVMQEQENTTTQTDRKQT